MPTAVPHYAAQTGTFHPSPKHKAVGDLTCIAFYYLLRVGEYTYANPKARKRTKQFRVCDITFWGEDNSPLQLTAPLSTLYLAKSATMRLTNQKNGVQGAIIHHHAILDPVHCPIRALARRVQHILQHTSDITTPISAYWKKPTSNSKHIMASNISAFVKDCIDILGLTKHGFHRNNVSSHSLRAGGAMAMHLANIDHAIIKKFGRWSSDTFLMYIHEQIGAFSKDISQQMSNNVLFENITGPTLLTP